MVRLLIQYIFNMSEYVFSAQRTVAMFESNFEGRLVCLWWNERKRGQLIHATMHQNVMRIGLCGPLQPIGSEFMIQ